MIQFLSCSGKGLPPKKLETNPAKTEDVLSIAPPWGEWGKTTPQGGTLNNYKRNKIDIDFATSGRRWIIMDFCLRVYQPLWVVISFYELKYCCFNKQVIKVGNRFNDFTAFDVRVKIKMYVEFNFNINRWVFIYSRGLCGLGFRGNE